MAELASGFITLPGGIRTLEETCEILTWAQVGIHKKPCGLLKVCGYYEHLLAHLDNMVEQGFFDPSIARCLLKRMIPNNFLIAWRVINNLILKGG